MASTGSGAASASSYISASRSSWLLSPSEVEASPSRADGMSVELEIEYGHRSCLLIESLTNDLLRGSHLRVRRDSETCRSVGVTAMVLVHRFYSRQSYKRHSRELVAGACFFLACKLEESPVHVRDVAGRVAYLMRRERLEGEAEEHMINSILQKEKIVLFTLECDIAVHLPFDLFQMEAFELARLYSGTPHLTRLRELGSAIAVEACHTTLCIEFTPEAFARCCVILAASLLKLRPAPSSSWISKVVDPKRAACKCIII